jgi:hypothetical protein
LESRSSWRPLSQEIFLRPRSLRVLDARAVAILTTYQTRWRTRRL